MGSRGRPDGDHHGGGAESRYETAEGEDGNKGREEEDVLLPQRSGDLRSALDGAAAVKHLLPLSTRDPSSGRRGERDALSRSEREGALERRPSPSITTRKGREIAFRRSPPSFSHPNEIRHLGERRSSGPVESFADADEPTTSGGDRTTLGPLRITRALDRTTEALVFTTCGLDRTSACVRKDGACGCALAACRPPLDACARPDSASVRPLPTSPRAQRTGRGPLRPFRRAHPRSLGALLDGRAQHRSYVSGLAVTPRPQPSSSAARSPRAPARPPARSSLRRSGPVRTCEKRVVEGAFRQEGRAEP